MSGILTKNFTQNFNTDTGFTYDSNLMEFVGGSFRQKDQRPSNSILGANFNLGLDLNWASDSFVDKSANIIGAPVLASGRLSCSNGSNGIYYEDSLIGGLSGDWVAKFKFIPNFTTNNGVNTNIFSKSPVSGSTDRVLIFHSPSGDSLRITAAGLSAVTFDVWQPVAGTEYVFEIFCTSNVVSVYIDGVQIGTGKTINPVQGTTANRVYLGTFPGVYNVANASYDDFILYSSASQTVSYTVPDYTYLESKSTFPSFIDAGEIRDWLSLSVTEMNSPRQIWNGLYYNGNNWVNSDGTFSQSNTVTELIAGLSSFPLENLTVELLTENGDTQTEISNFDLEYQVLEFPTLNTTILYGFLFDLANAVPAKKLKVKSENYLFPGSSDAVIITDDNISINLESSGYFEIIIKVENVNPTALIWSFQDEDNVNLIEEIKTDFVAGVSPDFRVPVGDLTVLS